MCSELLARRIAKEGRRKGSWERKGGIVCLVYYPHFGGDRPKRRVDQVAFDHSGNQRLFREEKTL